MEDTRFVAPTSTWTLNIKKRGFGKQTWHTVLISSFYGLGIGTVAELNVSKHALKETANYFMEMRKKDLESQGFPTKITEKFGWIVKVEPIIPFSLYKKFSIREKIVRSSVSWEVNIHGFFVDNTSANVEFLESIGAEFALVADDTLLKIRE